MIWKHFMTDVKLYDFWKLFWNECEYGSSNPLSPSLSGSYTEDFVKNLASYVLSTYEMIKPTQLDWNILIFYNRL